MSPAIERTIYALILTVIVGSGVRTALKAHAGEGAFTRWQHQLLQLKDGVDISDRHNYPNPPVMAVILEPLAHLSPVAGAITWHGLKVLMAVLSFVAVCQLVQGQGEAFASWARVLGALLCLKPVIDDLTHNNVNLFILALVVACFWAHRFRYDGVAGLCLALAIACKVTPALLVPYFLYKRAWRLLIGTGIGLILFLYPGFVPAARLGMQHNMTQLRSWYRVMVQPFADGKVTAEHINQSLPGLAHRLLTESPSFVHFPPPDMKETPLRHDNILNLSPSLVNGLIKGGLLLFGLVVVLSCRSPGRDGWRIGAEYGLVVLGMLLFSERTWKHHAVTLMVPLVVLAYRLPSEPRLWGVLVPVAILMVLPGLGGGGERETVWMAPPLSKLALVYGAYTVVFLGLATTMVVLLGRRASRDFALVTPAEEERPALAA